MRRKHKYYRNYSPGFTIVELMIATAVFSTILIAITVGVLHFSALYYKGVYTSETQNVARDISDEVANAVKFGTGEPQTIPVGSDGNIPPEGSNIVFCAGGYRFTTKLGEQYKETSTTTGFYMEPRSGGDCTGGDSSRRKQLLGKNMRVAGVRFYQNSPNLYTLKITIAYGDDDLLTAKSDASGVVQCRVGAGSEYCAVSTLVTTIEKRI